MKPETYEPWFWKDRKPEGWRIWWWCRLCGAYSWTNYHKCSDSKTLCSACGEHSMVTVIGRRCSVQKWRRVQRFFFGKLVERPTDTFRHWLERKGS